MKLIKKLFPILLLALGALVLLNIPKKADAQYVQNNLIDDNIFLNAASMTQSQIQTFLAARSGTLANYVSWSGRDNANVLASQIIYEAAQDYGVNPQVIMATMEKEESLVTDPSPDPSQYRSAMGYACPDSSVCDSEYYGLYNQVANGTWQLRFNFERSRGNDTWWNSSISYACNGATNYYTAALKAGNYVSFKDDLGNVYASFTLNNNATASLYCYTPHVYSTTSSPPYSGSINFVNYFELWFGSTQPAAVISTPLLITALPEGYYTNTPITVSFNIANNTDSTVNVGGMAVAVRDSNNNNFDYGLQNISVPAHGSVTYKSVQTFTTEGMYHFWITNLSGNTWSDTYPSSSLIDNSRQWDMFIQAMPTITAGPSSSVADMRVGESSNMSFTITNNSQWSLDAGKAALALRDPNYSNIDLPLKATGSIAPFGQYVYSNAFTPTKVGSYYAFVTDTMNGGQTWNNNNFPAQANGINRTLNFYVKPSPTITQSPTLSIASPRVGQPVTESFKVKNYSDASVNIGQIGLAVRDPNGRNVDAGSLNLSSAAGNTEYTFSQSVTYTTPGTYTAWITDTRDGGQTWDDTTFPALEPGGTVVRKIAFTVLPNPTITVGPTLAPSSPRADSPFTASFTVHNFSPSAVSAGSIALAIRDPLGSNVDCGLQDASNIATGQDFVYSCSKTFSTPGTYTAWITDTRDGGQTWDDTTFPALESSNLVRKITFTVLANPTITVGPTVTTTTPKVGATTNLTFTVHNYGSQTVDIGSIALAIRDPANRNVDCGLQAVNNLAAGQDFIYNCSQTFNTAGTYTAWITDTRDGGQTWNNTTYPAVDSSGVVRKITFSVSP